ncbi:MAG: S-adenosylmethionine:tRNA ribosyltransferase-isomerase, partial [Pseudomonadota bacterium]
MKLSDFDFDLPEGLIATRPARPRSSARLLVSRAEGLRDAVVRDLADHLYPGDRLIFNDTRVIPARLSGNRTRNSAQGEVTAKIDVTLLSPEADGRWSALIKPLRKLGEGEVVVFSP